MKPYQIQEEDEHKYQVNEDAAPYGLDSERLQEEARLIKMMNMTDMEKFRLFTRMLRVNAMYKKAKITHKA